MTTRKIHFSRNGFLCVFCFNKRKGAYRIVDEGKSCEKCNRAYDYKPLPPIEVMCPLCNGKGILKGG